MNLAQQKVIELEGLKINYVFGDDVFTCNRKDNSDIFNDDHSAGFLFAPHDISKDNKTYIMTIYKNLRFGKGFKPMQLSNTYFNVPLESFVSDIKQWIKKLEELESSSVVIINGTKIIRSKDGP